MDHKPQSTGISVVVPVFNGAVTLEELFLRTKDVLFDLGLNFEVIFVDDCSQDSSWEIIEKLQNEYGNRVRGFKLVRNSGQQAATFCGLKEAKFSWVLTIDDDLQYPPEEIRTLWEAAHQSNAQIIYGKGIGNKQGLLRRAGAWCYRLLLKKLTFDFPDGSSFRLIQGAILENLNQPIWPWSYVDPVLAWLTSDIAIIPIKQSPRESGKSGYSLFNLTRMALGILIVHSTLPLKGVMWVGFISALTSLGLGVYFLIQKLTVGAALGFSSLIVTITFVSGVLLITLGIIGLYLAKIYKMSFGQPPFLIKTKI